GLRWREPPVGRVAEGPAVQEADDGGGIEAVALRPHGGAEHAPTGEVEALAPDRRRVAADVEPHRWRLVHVPHGPLLPCYTPSFGETALPKRSARTRRGSVQPRYGARQP